ncbi:putative Raffinose synthase protein Sip1 [Taphrina deformans PYCC 5710]|uniref:Raffinose synthase protein Sip1 n=1 Tax=Taphrina deformans (strain PYCC 5710 / ATCC 11124 / CBS 356.35 / IMI 108563 / JCM 9778 / NBRC 8474) TaxID=1097556 RepID=R4XD18_TAPDE|nr:putative Raffinose synthase protein Sip1 [Taphrina deformans PYCC 5710]|eukprot:CCG82303.1 putative Raffinose synthase protein Sip1 [Taphrina deformans PYCC 5710]
MATVQIACSPFHLGTTDQHSAEKGPVTFSALVLSPDLDRATFQLELWWSAGSPSSAWAAEPFEETGGGEAGEGRYGARLHLDAATQVVDFTLRYRLTDRDAWSWVAEPGRSGRLLMVSPRQASSRAAETLEFLFTEPDGKLTIESPTSAAVPGTAQVSVLRGDAPPKAPDCTTFSLGQPQGLVQWISLERLMSFWMEPNQGREVLNTPRASFFVAYQRSDGSHVVMLPVAGLRDGIAVHFITEGPEDRLWMYVKNDSPAPGQGQVVISIADSIDIAVDAAFDRVRTIFQTECGIRADDVVVPKPEWYVDWTDGLFYCSWNAMYTDVNEQKLFDAIAGLHDQGVRVNGVIIDDGWQDIDEQRRWRSFRPPKDKFPNGLGGFVKELKRRYPYIKHVGVWHALMGYWNGFSPNSWISQHYGVKSVEMRKVTVPKGLETMHIVEKEHIHRLYDDFYSFLAGEGISVVKCDVQAMPDDISHSLPSDRLIWRDYQDAFKLASLRHFDRRVIYCMSHVSDIFLHALLQRNTVPACVRNSNDFFPDQEESHAWHIFWNANNAVYTSRLNCLPDWDMFDTTHPQAEFHAKSRSLSGGPILITDRINHTDLDLVHAMSSADISDSSTKIVRFTRPGKIRYPYVNFQDGRMTKVYNRTYDLLVLGVFNTTGKAAVEAVTLSDFMAPDVAVKERYIVTRIRDARRASASVHEASKVLFASRLKDLQCDLFTASPIVKLSEDKSCAVIGLLDKFAGAVAVNWYRPHESQHPILEVQVIHLGVLGIHVDFAVDVDRMLITMREVVVPKSTVTVSDGLLKLDLLAAWKELKLSGYSNELNLKFYFRQK